MTDSHWLSVGEACRALGVSRTTLLAAEDTGRIAPVRTPGGHRRYAAAEVRRYLGAGGARPGALEPAPAAPAGPVDDVELAATVRAAVRPLAHALDGECAGLYVHRAAGLRFAGAFGIPRWLTERLAGAPAPPEVVAALPAARARLFDPAVARFPDARSTGHAATVGLRGPDRPVGVLFLVTRATTGLLPAELRIVEAFADVLALLVASRTRAAALEQRLERIAGLCAATDRPPGA